MKAGIPKRFLTRRDKSGHRRNKSSDPFHKSRPLSTDIFHLFKPTSKPPEKEEDAEPENESVKVEEVIKRLSEFDINNATADHVLYALHSEFADGDVNKAVELMLLQKNSFNGRIVHYNPNVDMLGAQNREYVTCYLDALLFAMFAKLDAFECMLTEEPSGQPQKRLAVLLRLWVNMLRSGKLIHMDMTEQIQDALAECGWSDARRLEQQDTSEAFAFITETLKLPLLPLQVDLFHHGKNDEADHKVVYERLLNLAVPPDADGRGIKLEDCLEEYFNAQVDVHREDTVDGKVARRATLTPTPRTPTAPATPSTPKSTIRLVTADDDDDDDEVGPSAALPTENGISELPPLERRWTEHPDRPSSAPQQPVSPSRPHRSRTESIIQRVVLNDKGKPSESDTASLFERARGKLSVVKAVTIPAWQFFRLIPWHSRTDAEPQNDLEVARHFSQRPVVGICLKRYMVDEKGVPKRQNTFIDIPDSLRLPHFIVDDRHVEENGLSTDYKLVLQSVVCHRGDSLHSGHYISFCRVAPKLLTDNRRYDTDPPPDYEEAQWVKFDDLAETRVTTVDDIKQSLKDEMPYLLFYQIVPIVDVTASSTDGTDAEPPSYDDTTLQLKIWDAADTTQEKPLISRQSSSYFDNLSTLPSTNASVRFSSELERPSRQSLADDEGFLSVSRRGSVVYDHSTGHSPSVTPLEGPSPGATTPGEESTAHRLTRAAAKFRGGSKSRPQSQAGEGRISLTMSRLSGLVRASKDPLREPLRDSTFIDPADEEFEIVHANGTTTKETEKEKENGKENGTVGHRRGRSKGRLDKGKTREPKAAKAGDMPDRECVVQ